MKRTRTLCAALALTAAAALTACSESGLDLSALNGLDSDSSTAAEEPAAEEPAAEEPAAEEPAEESTSGGTEITAEDGYGEGRLGDTMQTYFFDYTVNSA